MAGGLDHLVIVAHDLDALAEFYGRLGFQVGARNRHDWGTLNNIVQFDGCFLELLTTEDGFERPGEDQPLASFTSVIDDYLDEREGLAMMVLEGFDAARDHEAYQAAGIGVPRPFGFRRQGRTPAGEPVEVAFSLAFAKSPAITDAGFFVCQQHAPELFWNAAFQVHENGAVGIRRVVFAAPDPEQHRAFFERYTGVGADAIGGGIGFPLARSRLEVVTPARAAELLGEDALPTGLGGPRFVAVEFEVRSPRDAAALLARHGVAFAERDGCIVVPAGEAFGLTVAFS
jgi:catechol 2,3-dioxygenase-like lactoylglutathione lyase family enzyme